MDNMTFFTACDPPAAAMASSRKLLSLFVHQLWSTFHDPVWLLPVLTVAAAVTLSFSFFFFALRVLCREEQDYMWALQTEFEWEVISQTYLFPTDGL